MKIFKHTQKINKNPCVLISQPKQLSVCKKFFNFILFLQVSIDGSEGVTGSGIIGENEQEKKMQVCKATFLYLNLFLLVFLDPSRDESKNWKLATSLEKFLPVQKSSVPLATAFSSYLRSQNS